ncbi:MAG: hypothetical protein E6772_16220 [Dysgonomonas sp.]|nr:hypothetical protein [Dysgonomonas sp.]
MEEKDKKQTVSRMEEPNYRVEDPDIPTPPEGKAWKRKSDGLIFYSAIYLGYLHFKNGEKLEEPIKEVPEDFELVNIENSYDLI